MSERKEASVVDYLQLFRAPNVFTAIADVTMGFLFVQRELRPAGVYGGLVAASVSFYLAGVVLNDVWDVEKDRAERPNRPIASGRIGVAHARRLGLGFLVSGVLLGWMAPCLGGWASGVFLRSGLMATALAASIVLYDAVLKSTVLGPVAMGLCRSLNILMGMAIGSKPAGPGLELDYGPHHLLVAGGIGLYVAGVTWFARTEARTSARHSLAAATAVMMAGVILLGLVFRCLPEGDPKMLGDEMIWWLLLALLVFPVGRRCLVAVFDPSPAMVQLAVRHAIWSLIVFDAAVVLLVAPASWALAVLALFIPTVLIGRQINST